jgi:uncharacterized membrane protein
MLYSFSMQNATLRLFSCYILGLFFIAAGANHFVNPDLYLKMMPEYLPYHMALISLSGAAEVGLGAMALMPRTRTIAKIGLVLLLVAVFPANVTMLQHSDEFPSIPRWVLVGRLPLQLALMLWVWWSLKVEVSISERNRMRL